MSSGLFSFVALVNVRKFWRSSIFCFPLCTVFMGNVATVEATSIFVKRRIYSTAQAFFFDGRVAIDLSFFQVSYSLRYRFLFGCFYGQLLVFKGRYFNSMGFDHGLYCLIYVYGLWGLSYVGTRVGRVLITFVFRRMFIWTNSGMVL